jgi:hypothetical protein
MTVDPLGLLVSAAVVIVAELAVRRARSRAAAREPRHPADGDRPRRLRGPRRRRPAVPDPDNPAS